MKLINIGYGNMINTAKLVSVVSVDSAPTKRLIQLSKSNGMLIDATQGRKTRSVLVMESNHVVLSYLYPETIAERLNRDEPVVREEDDE